MQVHEVLRRAGGVATTRQLLAHTTARSLRSALDEGAVVRTGRGSYVLPGTTRQREVAAGLHATLSHLSAAQHHGWPVLHPPDRAWLTVPRNRKLARATQLEVHATWSDLTVDEHAGGVTTPLRTVLDCARALPLVDALAVADSALRLGAVTTDDLRAGAAEARGTGARQVRLVTSYADARAVNPFESALRALTTQVTDLRAEPQAAVPTRGLTYHPDLVDVRRRLVLEADSWGFHADRQTHARDCVRYNALVVAGWTVLRFTWEHVVGSPAYVLAVLREVCGQPDAAPPTPDPGRVGA